MRRLTTANKLTVEIAQASNKQPINKKNSFKYFIILPGIPRLASGRFENKLLKFETP